MDRLPTALAGAAARVGLTGGVALAILGGALTASAAAGSAPAAGAFGVASASLSQQATDLRWTVSLEHSFDGASFAHDARSLCLLVERPGSGAVRGQVCLAAPRRAHASMRLTYAPVTPAGAGHAHAIAATITRSSSSELSATFSPAAAGLGYRTLRWQVKSAATGAHCPAGDPSSCTIQFPARPALARLHTPKLVGCVPRGPSLVTGGSSTRHEIALTFDDGPWNDPSAMDFVNLLAHYRAPATFFEIGRQIPEFDPTGAIERKMLADGDMIGDHTWSHPNMTTLGPAQQTSELQTTSAAIRRATGFTPCLWRPPYGATSGQLESVARGLGFLTVNWDVDTRDWALPGVGSIERTAIDDARNGSIIIMHFGGGPRQETLEALPTIITTLRRRGYRFVNVAQLLGLRLVYR